MNKKNARIPLAALLILVFGERILEAQVRRLQNRKARRIFV